MTHSVLTGENEAKVKTNLKPSAVLTSPSGKEVSGIWLGQMFIAMEPHNGHVELMATKSGKGCGYRIVKGGNYKNGLYPSSWYTLCVKTKQQPRTENEELWVAASDGLRLVVTLDRP